MTPINKYGRKRLEYLKMRQPQILKELEDHGILNIHLLYTQNRAICQMDKLMMAGMEKLEAEEYVLREIIRS
jgi:hypothetical protein